MNTVQSLLPPPQDSVILIVDDVQQNIQVVGTLLRDVGYSIMAATSGSAALQRVQKKPPDLILLDLMMPDVDGLEVCRQLKASPSTQHIPVIFLTASNEMNHLVQGFEAGAVDYITKPFNPPELMARVRTHLELKHSRDIIVRYSQQLAHLNNEKNEFMGIVAHDLRNPLSAIQGYAELLFENHAPDPTEVGDCAGRIRDLARRMSEMTQNLLDANAIERGEMKLNPGPVDLAQTIETLAENYRPRAAAKKQGLHVEAQEGAAMVIADANLVMHVLENLLSNAIKYSPPGKDIRLRLKHAPGALRCEVQDEGPGLSAEDQKKLFGKFARLSAKPTGGEPATGLGLSIVKRMVEAMNGQVWCESDPGRGATFVLQLPSP